MAEADRNKMRPQIAVMMVMVAVHVVGGVWCVVACGFLFLLLYISILFIFTIKFLPFRYFVSYFLISLSYFSSTRAERRVLADSSSPRRLGRLGPCPMRGLEIVPACSCSCGGPR